MKTEKQEMEPLRKIKVVVIGAGRAGRGYLARQFDPVWTELFFLDKNAELIRDLNDSGRYKISFFGVPEKQIQVKGYRAYTMEDSRAKAAVQTADYIFICVGKENLGSVCEYIWKAGCSVKNRISERVIIAAENGVGNLSVLRSWFQDGRDILSECLMLCTVEQEPESLDLCSEDVDYLPYDQAQCSRKLPFANFEGVLSYEILVRRKLYTYNTLSAGIAYLGAYKKYTDYGMAANDPWIYAMTDRLETVLNEAVCLEYGISKECQTEFSALAKKKFRNPAIRDTIARNARCAKRKLGPGERIAGPLELMLKHGISAEVLLDVAAAAFLYGITQENMEEEWILDSTACKRMLGLEERLSEKAWTAVWDQLRRRYRGLMEKNSKLI